MKSPRSNPTQTALVISTGFMAIHLASKVNTWLYLAFGIALLALLSPFLARKIEQAWMLLAKGLGYIMPNILLSLVFYLVLTPLAWLSRRFSDPDPLQVQRRERESLYRKTHPAFDKAHFEKTW